MNLTVLRSFRDLNSSDLLGVGHVLCGMLGKEDYFGDSLCRTEGESLTEYTRPDAGVMNCELFFSGVDGELMSLLYLLFVAFEEEDDFLESAATFAYGITGT